MKRRGRSLRAHLMLLYVLLAVLSGVIVPALVRHLSLSGFQDYLGRRRHPTWRSWEPPWRPSIARMGAGIPAV